MSTAAEDRAELELIDNIAPSYFDFEPDSQAAKYRVLCERLIADKAASERRPMGGEVMEIAPWQLRGIARYIRAQLPTAAGDAEILESIAAAIQSAKAEPVKAEAQAVATVTKLPSRTGNPTLDWHVGAEVHVGMKLYPHPASIDDIRRAAADLGYMLCRWEPIETAHDEALVAFAFGGKHYWAELGRRGSGALRACWYSLQGKAINGPNLWLSGLTAPKEQK